MSHAAGPPGPQPGPTPASLLEALARAIPIASIDELWLFPPRRLGPAESTVVVVSAFAEDPGRRRVLTARYSVSQDAKGQPAVQEELTEHGTAPADRIPRLVEGVLRRLDEPADAAPKHLRVEGSEDRWAQGLTALEE
ncbi:MAG TPA: hypothetical protein VFQ38_06355 [Longimicrobiales bacterium]|nr:hypothetical protein [Longimicrobiales bacterium]